MDKIKEKIENLRNELNLLIEVNEINVGRILEMSQELDKLILQYYILFKKEKFIISMEEAVCI